MTTKFIHIRPGRVYDAAQKRLVGTAALNGGYTIAYDIHVDAAGSPKTISYAMSACHWRDSYNGKLGRLISEGRLAKRRPLHYHVIEYIPGSTITTQILQAEGFIGLGSE